MCWIIGAAVTVALTGVLAVMVTAGAGRIARAHRGGQR